MIMPLHLFSALDTFLKMVRKDKIAPDIKVFRSLMSVYADKKSKDIPHIANKAFKVLDYMQHHKVPPSTEIYNCLLAACAHHAFIKPVKMGDRAFRVLEMMERQDGVKPDKVTVVSFLNVFLASQNEDQCRRATEWIEKAVRQGGSPVQFDEDLLGLAARIYVLAGNAERATELIAPFVHQEEEEEEKRGKDEKEKKKRKGN